MFKKRQQETRKKYILPWKLQKAQEQATRNSEDGELDWFESSLFKKQTKDYGM